LTNTTSLRTEENPMTRTWKMLGLHAVLAAALAASPALAEPAAPAGTPDPLEQYKKLDKIQKQLEEVQTSLAGLEAIKEELKNFRNTINLNMQKTLADVSDLQTRMDRLQRDLGDLRSQMSNLERKSFQAGPTGTASPAGGRIILRNTYPQQVSIIVNGRSYQLLPGEAHVLDNQPLGTFTYEILGGPTGVIQARVDRSLTADKPFEITVYPR